MLRSRCACVAASDKVWRLASCALTRHAPSTPHASLLQVNVMIVGSGGREHSLAWKLSQSPLCNQLYCAPGSPGTEGEAGVTNALIDISDNQAVCPMRPRARPWPRRTIPSPLTMASSRHHTAPATPQRAAASQAWPASHLCGGPCSDLLSIAAGWQVVDFCKAHDVEVVLVGPEVPLVAGLADELQKVGINTFGPSAAAAELEGSKSFMKVAPPPLRSGRRHASPRRWCRRRAAVLQQ